MVQLPPEADPTRPERDPAPAPSGACTLPRKPIGNPEKDKPRGGSGPVTDPRVWQAALQVIEIGWVAEERLADVVAWLAAHWHPGLELTAELRVAMNEQLAPPADIVDHGPHDERDWVAPLIAHVQHATGLLLSPRLHGLLGEGVVQAMLLLGTDRGRGKVIANRIVYARDEDNKLNGGLRAVLADSPGMDEHEAHKVALLLLGSAAHDPRAYPFRGLRHGMSGALVSSVFRLPVTADTALCWAHAAMRAIDPHISPTAMRRRVTRPIHARYRRLPDRLLLPPPNPHPNTANP